MQRKYPNFSPYCGMANNPILFRDVDGREIDLGMLTPSQKSQVIKTFSDLKVKSTIFSALYKYQETAKEVYNYTTSRVDANESELGKYASYNASIFSSASYRSVISINKNSVFESDNPDSRLQATIAEEVFHGGQAIFYGRKEIFGDKIRINKEGIQLETEAKVFRAYSGITSDGEEYINEFTKNKDVTAYFNALRSGNNKAIELTEGAFREQVKNLAGQVGELYGIEKEDVEKYQKDGGKTDFFDRLTKDHKLKK